mmetsp:Transcript_16715/g.38584  ORF Transcript_16715/g.38584 Transcript_16715/m.38584 type:complete len:756 (-) Transcript_16715:199-2466(-)|eukprot:CAMPEP_0197192406 /NCGR_PEP_ID=MMETSP1423-20130617/25016_1 /TAXON_ID=476441 /ORGANISM="Pseudo-nitzschia heimii, Strain UNC1101" /LENGTH=755 /DNA_ID=CAMNT_0042645277 /DNA_START=140 /DNA_END=2407 /DNA_ORIENTATION=-
MATENPNDSIHLLEKEYLPSECQIALFCLDYLRDLRRAYSNPDDMLDAEGLNADWLTLAIYALSRSFSMQGPLQTSKRKDKHSTNYNQVTMPVFNDCWMDSHRVLTEASPVEQEEMMNPSATPPEDFSKLPSLQEMTKQILLSENPREERDERDEKKNSFDRTNSTEDAFFDSYTWYDYDDAHPSNANRFYLLDGLAGSVNGRGPLLLGEVVAAGLCQLKAKARVVAEEEMVETPLFEQFVHAVESKGFFEDPEHETPRDDPQQEEERLVLQKAVYDDRIGKVVSKFRSKLASRMEADQDGNDVSAMTYLADYHHGRRMKRAVLAKQESSNSDQPKSPTQPLSPTAQPSSSTVERVDPSVTEAEYQAKAESLKAQGNAHMQKKEYDAALDCYTQALRLCPSGPNSHVYFSNRAAALLSMKMFDEAILDSERALTLAPTYGKAHARLGLAHFLLGDYRRAMEAYTVALKYEPENKSSKSYLEKAAKKLAAMSESEQPIAAISASYSVVSEWDKSNAMKQMGRGKPSDSSHNRTEMRSSQSKKKSTQDVPPSSSIEAAEKQKTLGNTQMASRDYQSALESYSKALDLSPDGPHSHVYYSNRAAALCYLERYEEAVRDSEVAIYLKPTYGKAHARMGLSKYFLNDYEASIAAYKTALKYDPDNASSKSYLAKAQLKLERKRHEGEDEQFNVSDEARRLMADPDMMHLAKKMMRTGKGISDAQLLEDPEMKKFARKAMSDPIMFEAIQSIPAANSKLSK